MALAFMATVGCARTAEERQLDSMREDIEQIQHDRDGEDPPAMSPDPVPAKEPGRSAARTQPAPAAASDVVRVGTAEDNAADDYEDPEDTTPRPAIRLTGAVRRGRGGEDAFESVTDDTTPRPMAIDPDAKRAYDGAIALVNARQYAKALDALAAFLVKWPDHPYADRAMFWRGECYFAQGDPARAAEELQGLLSRFPASAKAPDALLKLGVSQQKLGHATEAREAFDRLAQGYPQSEAARHIPAGSAAAAAPPGAAEDRR
jgi:tol-pal system protein YbgF